MRLVALIVVPLSMVCSYLAYQNYKLLDTGLESAQDRVVEDFAFRTRMWFRGVLRAAETFVAIGDPSAGSEGWNRLCGNAAAQLVNSSLTFAAVVIRSVDGTDCAVTRDKKEPVAAYLAESNKQFALESLQSWGTAVPFSFRYSATDATRLPTGMVQLRDIGTDGKTQSVSLFISLEQLDVVYEAGNPESSGIVGLVNAQTGKILAARGAREGDSNWLPKTIKLPAKRETWVGQSKDNRQFSYVAQEVVAPDIMIVAAFSYEDARISQLQLGVLAVAPIFLLLVFMAAYWRMVDRDVGRSIDNIETVASTASKGDFKAAVPVDDAMPLELRRASEAVNQIVQSASRRQGELIESAARYEDLMRELHHRVKNSLQVIQSYLAITRRQANNKDIAALHEAEVKVQVISVAYRYALTHLGLNTVPVKPFLVELLQNMAEQARSAGKEIRVSLDTVATLELDRVIPLGLALTEVIFTALRSLQTERVVVQLSDDTTGLLRVVVAISGDVESVAVVERTIRALRGQIGALEDPLEPNEILRWVLGPAKTD